MLLFLLLLLQVVVVVAVVDVVAVVVAVVVVVVEAVVLVVVFLPVCAVLFCFLSSFLTLWHCCVDCVILSFFRHRLQHRYWGLFLDSA